jgi:polyhydroxybutyrate depolymerase
MDYQADNYGLKQKAEEAGFIAVFPNGYSRLPGGILATWNAGACCGKAVENRIDDVGFLKEVIERVSRQANVDRTRVYSTGMSNGGLMSYRLACEIPHIRAIAPVAGTDNTLTCKPARPVPVIHFHARDDSHVLFTGGSGKDALTKTDFVSVPATIAKWVGINSAAPKARRVVDVPGAACDRHAAGPRGAPVQLCVTETGGHSWPGAPSRRANKNPSMAISANDLMWQFFQSI